MRLHKKGWIILVIFLAMLLFNTSRMVYSENDKCYYPSLPEMPCVDISADSDVASVEQCTSTGGSLPAADECNFGCCCKYDLLNKKYDAAPQKFKGYCDSFDNSVFKTGDSSYVGCGSYCQSLGGTIQDGKQPACNNGIDDDNDGLIDYPDDTSCISAADTSEEQTAEKKECMDGMDNDNDGKVDYFGFYENWFYTDIYKQPMFSDAVTKKSFYSSQLAAGVYPDPCCTDYYGYKESCVFDECSIGANTELCTCGQDICGFPSGLVDSYTTQGKAYITGKYCCNGQCSDKPCSACTEGETSYQTTPQGKKVFKCVGGKFIDTGQILPLGTIEQCLDPAMADQDNDGLANCMDPECFSMKCSDQKAAQQPPQGCGSAVGLKVSYLDEIDDFWKCCFPQKGLSRAKDCKYNDGIPDTCGQCECLKLHKPAQQLKVEHSPGKALLNLSFYFECQESSINLKIMRCKGTKAQCGESVTLETSTKFQDITPQMECWMYIDGVSDPQKKDCFGVNGVLQPGKALNAGEALYAVYDTKIQPQTDYTYVIKSIYPDKEVSFSPTAYIQTGHEICFSHTGHFCIRNNEKMSGSETKRYYCDDNNLLQVEEICEGSDDEWSGEICMEEKDAEQKIVTACASNSPCIFCGQPFNMYGFNDSAELKIPKAFSYDASESEKDCTTNPLCYYDSTLTVKDAYDSCSGIGSCSDYKSTQACTKYIGDFNNKCLAYGCNWNSFEVADAKLELGLCTNEVQNYNKCELCNNLNSNKVFASCTKDICFEKFSTDTNLCYIDFLTNDCVDSSKLTCSSYKSSKDDCVGDNNGYVDVDVTYSGTTRVWGTNKIEQKSDDRLSFGVCKFKDDSDICIKDADGDGKHDITGSAAIDINPPSTEVIADANVDEIQLKFSVIDPEPQGRPSSGGIKTFYCFPEDKEVPKEVANQYDIETTEEDINLCYPDILFVPDAGKDYAILSKDNGQHTMYYFSVDNAKNLEEVKKFTFNVDKKPPTITITPYITLDQSYPYDSSSVLFYIELDEAAEECYDIFEDYTGIKKLNYEQGQYFQAIYPQLKDGTYLYTVVCKDKLDNMINKSISIIIDADFEIQGAMPKGIIDYSPISLEVKSLHKAECRYGTTDNFDLMSAFTASSQAGNFMVYSAPISLTTNGVYEFKVLCKVPSLGNKMYDDEIQFVYDTIAPLTSLVGASGQGYEISQWFNSEEANDALYMQCNDEPEYGFGCNKTKYCLESGAAKCSISFDDGPNSGTAYEPYSSIDVKPSAVAQWLCYQSRENTEKSLNALYGGLIEEKQCFKLLVDSDQGPVIDVPLLKQYTDPLSAYEYHTSGFLLEGDVIDSDAQANPPASNKLKIEVYGLTKEAIALLEKMNKNTTGNAPKQDKQDNQVLQLEVKQTIDNIDANSHFSQSLTLVPGFNKIVLTAKDRSGKTSFTEYYIVVSVFGGELFEVVSPIKGVSDTKEFDMVIETTKDLPKAESCSLSTNPQVGFTAPMQQDEGRTYKKHINFPGMKEGAYYTVYVKCTFPGGIFAVKQIDLIWDTSAPAIDQLFIEPSDRKDPPSIVEEPLTTNITVVTNDKSRCKFSTSPGKSYFAMTPFSEYDNLSYVNRHTLSALQDLTNYTYYVRCDNGPTEPASGHISGEKKVSFSVNTSLFTGFTLVKPEQQIGYTSVNFELHSTKQATSCTFGSSEETVGQYPMQTVSQGVDKNKVHKGGPMQLTEDKHHFYFVCQTAAEGPVMSDFVFLLDNSPPNVSINTQPITNSVYSLTADWEGTENTEGITIKGYNFSLGTAKGLDNIFEWTYTEEDKKTLKDLNITNMTTYWWNVRAKNSVGLWGGIVSNSTFVDTSYDPGFEIPIGNVLNKCQNDIKDNNETDIDCGGPCEGCTAGKNCINHDDCLGKQCKSSICISSSCDDGVLNQLETDIDCGGSCVKCAEGMNCNINSDCSSGYCKSGICSKATCLDGVQNGYEEGIDCGGACPDVCEILEGPEPDASCDDGILNQDEEQIDCGGACKPCETIGKIPAPQEGSSWWLWLLVFLIITALAGGGYYYYNNYLKPYKPSSRLSSMQPGMRPKTSASPPQMSVPLFKRTASQLSSIFKPLSKEDRIKQRMEKQKQRSKIFGVFGEGEASDASNKSKASEDKTDTSVNSSEKPELRPEQKPDKKVQAEQRQVQEADMKKQDIQKPDKAQKLEISSSIKNMPDEPNHEMHENFTPSIRKLLIENRQEKLQTKRIAAARKEKPTAKSALNALSSKIKSSSMDRLSALSSRASLSKGKSKGKGSSRAAIKQLSKIVRKK